MENLSDSHDEETLELASKTWNRVIDSVAKTGFREGIADGSMSVFQDGFDRGYKEAFKITFLIGIYKGLANCLIKELDHPTEIENLLSKTKRGICYLCEMEIKDAADVPEKTIVEIENCQKEHSSKILKSLEEYFHPLLKKHNIDLDLFNAFK